MCSPAPFCATPTATCVSPAWAGTATTGSCTSPSSASTGASPVGSFAASPPRKRRQRSWTLGNSALTRRFTCPSVSWTLAGRYTSVYRLAGVCSFQSINYAGKYWVSIGCGRNRIYGEMIVLSNSLAAVCQLNFAANSRPFFIWILLSPAQVSIIAVAMSCAS